MRPSEASVRARSASDGSGTSGPDGLGFPPGRVICWRALAWVTASRLACRRDGTEDCGAYASVSPGTTRTVHRTAIRDRNVELFRSNFMAPSLDPPRSAGREIHRRQTLLTMRLKIGRLFLCRCWFHAQASILQPVNPSAARTVFSGLLRAFLRALRVSALNPYLPDLNHPRTSHTNIFLFFIDPKRFTSIRPKTP